MSYLLDTHILLWLIADDSKIKKSQLDALKNINNDIYISNISFLEIALKYQKGRLALSGLYPENLLEIVKDFQINIVDINAEIMATLHKLPQTKNHKDPFDRLLIWFCIQNNYTFISSDTKLQEYEPLGLQWL